MFRERATHLKTLILLPQKNDPNKSYLQFSHLHLNLLPQTNDESKQLAKQKKRFFLYRRRAILTNPDLLPKTPWTQILENDYWGTPLSDSGSHGSYRPLSVFTLRLNYLMGGYVPWGYHLVNIILHCSATYLLIKIAKNVLPKSKRKVGSIVTGTLFACHPIHTEAVASVVGKSFCIIHKNKSIKLTERFTGRADLLACNFFFLSLLAYSWHVKHRDSTCCSKVCEHKLVYTKCCQKRYDRIVTTTLQKSVTSCNWPKNNVHTKDVNRSRFASSKSLNLWCCWLTFVKIWWYMFVCLVFAVCAMLSKETGITVLGMSLVYDFVYSSNQRWKVRIS